MDKNCNGGQVWEKNKMIGVTTVLSLDYFFTQKPKENNDIFPRKNSYANAKWKAKMLNMPHYYTSYTDKYMLWKFSNMPKKSNIIEFSKIKPNRFLRSVLGKHVFLP